jgi:hypothetical protein
VVVHLKGPLEIVNSLARTGSRAAHQAEERMLVHPKERSWNRGEEAAGSGSTLRKMHAGKDHGD